MREIKFRAWDSDYQYMTAIFTLDDIFGGFVGFKNREVMQYTGIKAKDGAEIYEGDILDVSGIARYKVEWDGEFAEFTTTCIETFCLELSMIENHFDDQIEDGVMITAKVIGNIYENPDLLDKDIK